MIRIKTNKSGKKKLKKLPRSKSKNLFSVKSTVKRKKIEAKKPKEYPIFSQRFLQKSAKIESKVKKVIERKSVQHTYEGMGTIPTLVDEESKGEETGRSEKVKKMLHLASDKIKENMENRRREKQRVLKQVLMEGPEPLVHYADIKLGLGERSKQIKRNEMKLEKLKFST